MRYELGVILISCIIVSLAGCTSTGGDTSNYEARIYYNGHWTGTLDVDGNTRSIEGTGFTTIPINNPKHLITVKIQKMDDSRDKLQVEVLKRGSMEGFGSTTEPYGIVEAFGIVYH